MLHLFIEYSHEENRHKRTMDVLWYQRENTLALKKAGYLVTTHKITDSMRTQPHVIDMLRTKGIEDLPALINPSDNTIVTGVAGVKKMIDKYAAAKKPEEKPIQYNEPAHAYTKESETDEMFGGSDQMMDIYKKQLAMRPASNLQPSRAGRELQQPTTPIDPDSIHEVHTDNVLEEQTNGAHESLQNLRMTGNTSEDDDLMAKLLDNMSTDDW